MSHRNWQDRIRDILDSANNIVLFTDSMIFDTLINDPKTIRAVAFELTTIGEAANSYQWKFKKSITKSHEQKSKAFEMYLFINISR